MEKAKWKSNLHRGSTALPYTPELCPPVWVGAGNLSSDFRSQAWERTSVGYAETA